MFKKIKLAFALLKVWKRTKAETQKAVKEAQMDSKKWYTSKTVWFNILSGVVAICGVLAAPDAGISPKYASIFTTVVMVANIFLRLISGQPIENSPADKS